VAIHAQEATVWWIRAATLLSIATAVAWVRMLTALIPPAGSVAAARAVRPAVHQHVAEFV